MTSPAIASTLRWAPSPAVGSVTPATGTSAGGTNVTIAGTGFTGATAVLFDTKQATNFVVVSDISITCTTPPHAAGAVDVFVMGTGYEASGVLAGGYTYT